MGELFSTVRPFNTNGHFLGKLVFRRGKKPTFRMKTLFVATSGVNIMHFISISLENVCKIAQKHTIWRQTVNAYFGVF